MSGTAWDQQVNSAMEYCQDMLQRIDKSPLPIFAKCKAVNMIVMLKLQFHFSNTHFTVKSLLDLENTLVRLVHEWFNLNTSATWSFMFVPKWNGGLGLRNPMTLYNSKRLSFLLSVLNSKDTLVKKVARESLTFWRRLMEQRSNFLVMGSTVRIRSLRVPNSVGEGPIWSSSTSYALE